MADNDTLTIALTSLETWLCEACVRAENLGSALEAGASAVVRMRRSVEDDPAELEAVPLVRAFGAIAAEHAGLQRALDGAEERLEQLPIRLDPRSIKPL